MPYSIAALAKQVQKRQVAQPLHEEWVGIQAPNHATYLDEKSECAQEQN
ncbi:hypothetical protein GCM10007377_07070 [Galliscardovia ingluviei]|uniref:Uncharacterized protein n=1 Tax=Galliscardovia ingluviei TaxID=1769422 RepID=A0A8J3AH13_9BIFI|nr:hypothetical protein GCM10007377_07070 [Galliscardovia ingluviei]